MIFSKQLQNLESSEFAILYEESYIISLVQEILCLVLEEAFIKKSKILVYNLEDVPKPLRLRILEALKEKFKVSSIYIDYNKLFIDWSL